MQKKKIIIDTDCGSDDAMAIAMALNDPGFEIVMITTVCGNVDVGQATLNALTTIERAGTYEPPVYKGATHPLLHPLAYAFETHGRDGMGDIGLLPQRLHAREENGVFKLLEALRSSKPGEIDVIALGPLTNLALAARLEPGALRRAGRIVAMASAGLGPGNVTPVAEFNVWQDAEAARIVVEAGLCDVVFVGWDACTGRCMLTPAEIETIRDSGPLGRFAIDCNHCLMELNQIRFGEACLDMADPSAVAAALHPSCIADCEKYYCQVDSSAGPSYGAVLVDRDGTLGKEPNLWICSRLHPEEYKEYLFCTLRAR